MVTLPAGIVSFLFTDIEGSTRLVHSLGDDFPRVLGEHRTILRRAFAAHDGIEVSTEGDSFFVAFARASDALHAAVDAQLALAGHQWPQPLRVRMGIHTGEAARHEDTYVGMAVHVAARVMAAAHGGQILATVSCRERAGDAALEVRDLGEHLLKDIDERVRLLQVLHPDLPRDFPPPKTAEALRGNLPGHLPSLVGREAELGELIGDLAGHRLVSLVGAGGSGKTRLALEIALRTADRYADGAWLVELASVTDPKAMPQAIAGVFSLRDQQGHTLEDALIRFLARRDLLIVLDNCEHLVDAAATFVAGLLRGAPSVKILATSREPLAVAGEVARRIPSLTVPSETDGLEEIAHADSVRLFVERARALLPGFRLTPANAGDVARICARLDGIPLAIELAAARMPAMDPAAVAERLGDRFRLLRGAGRGAVERQQTLHAAIDWSYRLLTPDERTALERLSAFSGGWTLSAAEAVCGDGLESEVYELVAGLVSKSLVNAIETPLGMRYGMLETIRQYAREKLADSGDGEAIERAHARYYAEWAVAAEPFLEGADQAGWLARADAESENLLAALATLSEDDDARHSLAMATALWRWWWLRGRWREGCEWLRTVAARAGWPRNPLGAQCRWAIAFLNAFRGVEEDSRELLEEAASICHEADDLRGLAFTMWTRAWSSRDPDEKARLLEDALDMARRSGDAQATAWALSSLGSWTYESSGSVALYEESYDVARRAGERWGEAMALNNLGEAVYCAGDFARAAPMVGESIEIFRAIRDLFGLAEALRCETVLAWLTGDRDTVRARLDEARRILIGTDGQTALLEFLWPAMRSALEAGDKDEALSLAVEAREMAGEAGTEPAVRLFEDLLLFASKEAPAQAAGDAGVRAAGLSEPRARLWKLIGAAALTDYLAAESIAESDPRAAEDLARTSGLSALTTTPWDAALAIELMARVSSDPVRALTLFAAAEAARERHGGARLPQLAPVCAAAIERARKAAGEDDEGAWTRGRALTPREALALD